MPSAQTAAILTALDAGADALRRVRAGARASDLALRAATLPVPAQPLHRDPPRQGSRTRSPPAREAQAASEAAAVRAATAARAAAAAAAEAAAAVGRAVPAAAPLALSLPPGISAAAAAHGVAALARLQRAAMLLASPQCVHDDCDTALRPPPQQRHGVKA